MYYNHKECLLSANLAPEDILALGLALCFWFIPTLLPVDGLTFLSGNVCANLSRYILAHILLNLLGYGSALLPWYVGAHLFRNILALTLWYRGAHLVGHLLGDSLADWLLYIYTVLSGNVPAGLLGFIFALLAWYFHANGLADIAKNILALLGLNLLGHLLHHLSGYRSALLLGYSLALPVWDLDLDLLGDLSAFLPVHSLANLVLHLSGYILAFSLLNRYE